MFGMSANVCELVQLAVLRSNIRECAVFSLLICWLHCPRFPHSRCGGEPGALTFPAFGDLGHPLTSSIGVQWTGQLSSTPIRVVSGQGFGVWARRVGKHATAVHPQACSSEGSFSQARDRIQVVNWSADRFLTGSPNSIASLPEEEARRSKTSHGQAEVQLDDGPDPEASQGRGPLQDSNVAIPVGDVYQVASSDRSHGEEYGLSGVVLESLGQTGDDGGGGGVGVKSVYEGRED